ncbi:MAG: hypothetical protein NWE99_02415 [Candidatus Bathyarchaeota archaeon]|nr:hypothetical protein [Candidatus Bathyarchaeota archaeon]
MVKDILIANLIQHLSNRLNLIEKRHAYLSFLIQKRFANEKLLQLETMNIISNMPETVDYLPEKPYNSESKEKCDFWFKTKDAEYWLEIKTRPTNYRKPGHAKAITNGVDGVIEDISRLKKISDLGCRKFVLFAFYPMYEESYETFVSKHLSRVVEAAGKRISSPEISIRIRDASFDIYIVEL